MKFSFRYLCKLGRESSHSALDSLDTIITCECCSIRLYMKPPPPPFSIIVHSIVKNAAAISAIGDTHANRAFTDIRALCTAQKERQCWR